MERQQSFTNDKATLYLVATPIGNLLDFSFRAIETLKSVDVIFAEDTRVSINLLKHYDISKPLLCYHEFNKDIQGNTIINKLKEGKNVGLISDAGMPVISDPGYDITKEAIKEGFNVVAIPGANAALTALIVSGLAPMPFTFYGFLDSKEQKRKKELMELREKKETLIFYESPHRISAALTAFLDIFGDRQMVLVRELTKKFEEVIRGTISEVLSICSELKGEMVLIIDGNKEEKDFTHISIIEHVNLYIKEGLKPNDAIKKVAADRNMVKQDVYKQYHSID